ncbi:MAG: tryptophan-rich sensory protein [Sphaerochaetaceae bacterium]
MENTTKKRLALVILNTIGLIVTIVFNALANALPLNGRMTGDISDSIPNLFVPSGLTFAIWGPIYALLILLVAYQWYSLKFKDRDIALVEQIGYWFFISSVANTFWIITWHWSIYGLDLVMMLLLLVSLIIMHTVTRKLEPGASWVTKFMVAVPFSVYLGWITVATVANVTSNLVVVGWNGFGLPEAFWTVLVMIVAAAINVLAVLVHADYAYALVGIWAFLGIYLKRTMSTVEPVQSVIVMAIIGMVLMAAAIVFKATLWRSKNLFAKK